MVMVVVVLYLIKIVIIIGDYKIEIKRLLRLQYTQLIL